MEKTESRYQIEKKVREIIAEVVEENPEEIGLSTPVSLYDDEDDGPSYWYSWWCLSLEQWLELFAKLQEGFDFDLNLENSKDQI